MDNRKNRKKRRIISDEDSEDEQDNMNSPTDNNLANQILKIFSKLTYKSCTTCTVCKEIKNLVQSSPSSGDSGLVVASSSESEKPKFKSPIIEVLPNKVNEENTFIKPATNKRTGRELISNKSTKSVGKLPKSKKAKIDLIAHQEKNNKIFNKLYKDYRKNSPVASPKEKLIKYDFDGNEIIEQDENQPPEISQTDKFVKPSTSKYLMSPTKKQKTLTTQKSKRNSFPTSSKNKLDFDNFTNGNETIKNDKVEHQPGRHSTSAYSLRSENTSRRATYNLKLLSKPIKLDFDTSTIQNNKVPLQTKSKNKLDLDDYSNFLKFDLEGNEIMKNGKSESKKKPEIPQSENLIKPTTNLLSLKSRNTLPKAENSYAKYEFDETIKRKLKATSSSEPRSKKKLSFNGTIGRRKSDNPKQNKAVTTETYFNPSRTALIEKYMFQMDLDITRHRTYDRALPRTLARRALFS